MDDNIHYSKVINENLEKGFQVRLVINEFRDVLYFQLRKYFLSYDAEWIPSKEGISMPAELENIYAVLDGLLEVCSIAEGREIIEEYAFRLQKQDQEKLT